MSDLEEVRRRWWRAGASRRLLRLAVVLAAAALFSCDPCPGVEDTELCRPQEEWEKSGSCTDFPKPPEGEQCPTLAAAQKACSPIIDLISGPRARGTDCCYVMAGQCE